MAEKLTQQQLQAVEDRGGKLLVSAAAGSGKTKVLVDRLMSYLTDPVNPANLDEFLIITYTKAAAAELRGKIAAKLTERIAAEPENRHLQQQMQRLYLAKISTVHAFCTDLLRDYAYRLDISGDFRVAEENECLELQMHVMEQLLDHVYENAENDPDFCAFIDSQGLGRDDRQIPDIILKVYNSARCHLNPDEWLEWCLSISDVSAVTDAAETVWGHYLIADLHQYLDLHIKALEKCAQLASASEGMEKPASLLYGTVDQLRCLRGCCKWDDIVSHMSIDYGRLTFSKKCSDSELAERIKAVREACKKGLAKKLRKFSDNSQLILEDISRSSAAGRGLVSLVRQFGSAYDRLKRSRRVLDFSDLEHKTLDLLLGKKRSGATAIADEVGQRYREVMVDEYQDSNTVQDAIFEAITRKRQNCFMVGDVKQSIYQFRLADPGIFLEKYNTFTPAERAVSGQGRKVLLSSNFRSSNGVISAVNDVFSVCMSEQVGGLAYGEDEVLREGLPHTAIGEPEIELYGLCIREDTYAEEAAFVAERIAQLLDGTHMVRQGDELRSIVPGDIVILLRSPGSVGEEFCSALEQRGIRCNTGGSMDLLKTEEVETLRSILQTIDNPLQDIPLVAALTSRVFGFTADDLAAFRSERRGGSIYSSLRSSKSEKAKTFLDMLENLRREARMNSLPQLLQRIFAITRMDSLFAAMPDGEMRIENLQSFCLMAANFDANGAKTLSRFLRHLDAMEKRGLVASGEQNSDGAVTIMSIHKSKGLEFPVVFLCGLSREFNRDSTRAQVLCDKELGLGLSCVDRVNRVRYPSVAKRAIAAKMIAESLSEEMRVLYVAMTRPRDRLIMTYASKNLENTLSDIELRMDLSDPLLMTGDVDCPGKWILMSALLRPEAGAFFSLGGYPVQTHASAPAWLIRVVEAPDPTASVTGEALLPKKTLPERTLSILEEALTFRYAHSLATKAPSKQTATQLKGREKDKEAAENTQEVEKYARSWRKPSFTGADRSGTAYGSVLHTVMEYIRYDACSGIEGVNAEIKRLVNERYISPKQGEMVDAGKIADFFATDLGTRLRSSKNILREFKFSILDDGSRYSDGMEGEKVLLQGVVDCALVESDGITVIDFKTDRVTDDTLPVTVEHYRPQVVAYADAMARIYQMPVKSTQLYFFSLGKFISV